MSSRSTHHHDRGERRRSPSPRRRRDSPGPSSSRHRRESPKKDSALPRSFDRESRENRDDQRTVLERMEKACDSVPMRLFLKCIREKCKVKVWTRNYKEVRGICSGYIEYFDKHWNLVMTDVEEIYLRPKKGKTPYLLEVTDSNRIPEAKPKVPKEKKKAAEGGAVAPPPPPPPVIKEEYDEEGNLVEKPKKKRRKKKKNKMENRKVSHLFLRGDNIVMVAVSEVVEEELENAEDEEDDDEPEIIEIKKEDE